MGLEDENTSAAPRKFCLGNLAEAQFDEPPKNPIEAGETRPQLVDRGLALEDGPHGSFVRRQSHMWPARDEEEQLIAHAPEVGATEDARRARKIDRHALAHLRSSV